MSPSAGLAKVLVARNLKVLRLAAKNQIKSLQNFLFGRSASQLQPIYARVAPRQPIHPAAWARQNRRWFSSQSALTSAVRRFTTASGKAGSRYERSTFPVSKISKALGASTGRAPFASTLRPNLTGGALNRTAGGYGIGAGRPGGARCFSHGPATTGQVITNVSQAVRAFFISGQKVQYDGVNACTGGARYKAVSPIQDQALQKVSSMHQASPGAFIDFPVNPSITALTPLATIPGFTAPPQSAIETLHTEGLLDVLSVDFSRALKELVIIMNDLKKLSALGDLPITYENTCLRIHFPGCGADTVECLALELDLQRGSIGQDDGFDAFVGTDMALLFPFAPSQTISECSFYEAPTTKNRSNAWFASVHTVDDVRSHRGSTYSIGYEPEQPYDCVEGNAWSPSPSGYDSLRTSEISNHGAYHEANPLEYSGIEGIYRFIEQCDAAARD